MEESFKFNDKVYILSPLNTLGDLKEIIWTFQHAKYLELKEHANEVPQEALIKTWRECEKIKLTEEEIEAKSESLFSMIYLLFLSLKKKYPELTKVEVANILTQQNNKEIMDKISLISGWKNVVEKKTEEVSN